MIGDLVIERCHQEAAVASAEFLKLTVEAFVRVPDPPALAATTNSAHGRHRDRQGDQMRRDEVRDRRTLRRKEDGKTDENGHNQEAAANPDPEAMPLDPVDRAFHGRHLVLAGVQLRVIRIVHAAVHLHLLASRK